MAQDQKPFMLNKPAMEKRCQYILCLLLIQFSSCEKDISTECDCSKTPLLEEYSNQSLPIILESSVWGILTDTNRFPLDSIRCINSDNTPISLSIKNNNKLSYFEGISFYLDSTDRELAYKGISKNYYWKFQNGELNVEIDFKMEIQSIFKHDGNPDRADIDLVKVIINDTDTTNCRINYPNQIQL